MDSAHEVVDRLRAAGCLERNAAIATAHPGLYEVSFTLDRV